MVQTVWINFSHFIIRDLPRSNDVFYFIFTVQWNLDLRKPDLRKNLNLRKIVGTTDFLVHKLFDLRKIL